LKEFDKSTDIEIITVGLDTVLTYKILRQRIGDNGDRDEGESTFEDQLKVVNECDIILKGDKEQIYKAFNSVVELLSSRGVLVKDSITNLINAGTLLENTVNENIKPASYDLRVGSTAWCKGETIKIDADGKIAIPPYSYIIIKAEEQAHLPNFIIAHYDIRVSLFVKGVILSNGPQVDPGFHGSLLCMLFNGSDTKIGLRRGEHFATIEFFITTKKTLGYREHHQGKKSLEDYMESTIAFGPGGTISDKFDDLKKTWETYRNSIIIIGITLIIALVSAPAFLVWWGYDMAKQNEIMRAQIMRDSKEVHDLIIEERALRDSLHSAISDSTTSNDVNKQN